MNDTVLIIGSAPDAVRAKEFDARRFDAIVVLNNAWRIRDDWTRAIYPDDLPVENRPQITDPDRQSIITSGDYVPSNNVFGGVVYAGATMAFTAAYWVLDALKPKRLAFVGCDMIYDQLDGDSHFYGKGEADPLRDDPTLQSLEAKANRLAALARQAGCDCINLSIGSASRLTFPRASADEIDVYQPLQFDEVAIERALQEERIAGQYFPSGDYWNSDTPPNGRVLKIIDDLWLKTVVSAG
ncbi:MAG: hypothetical protein AAGF28_02270 [Pseudomonadota bacterium]